MWPRVVWERVLTVRTDVLLSFLAEAVGLSETNVNVYCTTMTLTSWTAVTMRVIAKKTSNSKCILLFEEIYKIYICIQDDKRVRGSNPGRSMRFYSSPKTSRTALGLTQTPIKRVPGFFPGGKTAGREVNHSPPFRVEVKNKWCYTSTPSICLQGADTETITFL